MKIEQVDADAFGPFRKETLLLAPGMTVVYGPNEAGKSSWFAAVYAAMCGRRRARGRGTVSQRVFKDRHQPWRGGSGWRVGATLLLENGRHIHLAHNLRDGSCVFTDATDGHELRLEQLESELGHELTTDSTVDGARFLGLNRDSARATIFVGQGDVLRALNEASELQEYLQRAATSNTVDITAQQALTWLAEQRRERVGVAHVGSRPLRSAMLEVEQARAEADRVRDSYGAFQDAIAARRRMQADLFIAQEAVAGLERLARQAELASLEGRIAQVEELTRALQAAVAHAPATPAVVREVSTALDAHRDRGDEPVAPTGPSGDDLRAQLAALPPVPTGDLEPSTDVVQGLARLRDAETALATHTSVVMLAPVAASSPLSADELREIAAAIEAQPPAPDPSVDRLASMRDMHQAAVRAHAEAIDQHTAAMAAYRAEYEAYAAGLRAYEAERVEYETAYAAYLESRAASKPPNPSPEPPRGRRPKLLLVAVGAFGIVIGLSLFIWFHPATAVTVILMGLAVLVAGLVGSKPTAPAPVAAPAPPPEAAPPQAPTAVRAPATADPGSAPPAPQPTAEISSLQAIHDAWVQMCERVERNREAATTKARAAGLAPDSTELRQLARSIDSLADETRRRLEFEARRSELQAVVDHARSTLREALMLRGVTVDPGEGEFAASDRYLRACRERHEQGAAAARRPDLEESLRLRVEREMGFADAFTAHAATSKTLLELATRLDCDGSTLADAVAQLERWIARQEAQRVAEGDQREQSGRLAEMLDGKTVEALIAEREVLRRAVGGVPQDVPDDLDSRLDLATQRRDAVATRLAQVDGQIAEKAAALRPVAEVIEAEAEAERRLEAVQKLARMMDITEAHLASAKDRAQATIAPALAQTMAPWLPRITDGRYGDLTINADDLMIEVQDAEGTWRDATLLSHGTTEQIYILLRLSLAQHLATTDEVAPMILDDVTVHSDPARTIAMLGVLHELSRHRQIVLFTQEQEVIEWAEQRLQPPLDLVVPLVVRR